MAATVSAVATAIKTQLATISNLRTFDYQPEQLNPPVAFPILNSINYHRAFQGGDVEMNWSIVVVVGRYLDRVAHTNLDGYLSYSGTTSIRAALEADKTLGGVVQTCVLDSAMEIDTLTVGDADFLQIQLSLRVHA